MPRHGPPAGGSWLALLAFAGLLLGHFVAYVAVAPDEGVRSAVLEATGHRAHGVFVPVGGAALLAAAIRLIVHQFHHSSGAAGSSRSPIRLGVTLWLLQTVAFVVLEASERLFASHAVTELLHEPAFLVGLVLQAVAALAGTILVLLLKATAAVLRRCLARQASSAATPLLGAAEVLGTPRSVAQLAWSLRGPPLSPLT